MNLEGIIAIAIGVVIAALALAVKIEAGQLAKARAENGVQAQQLTQDTTALRTAGDSLDAALAAVKQWQTACTADAAQLSQARADLTALSAQLATSHAALLAAEAKDRATPRCAALLGADLAAACPGVAARVRVRPAAPGGGH